MTLHSIFRFRELIPFDLGTLPDAPTAPTVARFSANGADFGAFFSSAYVKMGALAPESNPNMQLFSFAP